MPNLFKTDYSIYKDNFDESVGLAGDILRQGKLSLITGAGVSKPIGLPDWKTLVVNLCKSSGKSKLIDLVADEDHLDLKRISEEFKSSFLEEEEYLEMVQSVLYKGIALNLDSMHKPMMTALSSLFIGNHKGKIKQVITYNFDNLLNWYLNVLGFSVNTEFSTQAMDTNEDCSIFHIHGFLPHPNSDNKVKSKSIVFTEDEFSANIRNRQGLRMQKVKNILTRTCFLSVGVSYSTLWEELKPEINELREKWYLTNDIEEFQRDLPFGICIQLTERDGEIRNIDSYREDKLLNDLGIITLKCKDFEVPETIFKITRNSRFNYS